MTFTDILFDVSDGIATITLHRPDALNAFTNQMVRDLKVAFDEVDGNDDIRALVMTGSGRAFCAGAD
jgi:enoyl-CoA hydratase/carnithine racemase